MKVLGQRLFNFFSRLGKKAAPAQVFESKVENEQVRFACIFFRFKFFCVCNFESKVEDRCVCVCGFLRECVVSVLGP